MKFKTFSICLLLLAFFTQNIHAQNEDTKKRKMTITTKTVDENGKETITTIVREGDEFNDEDIDKLIQKHLGEGAEINVNVEVEGDGEHITITETKGDKSEKHITIIKDGKTIEIDGDDDGEMIFISEDGQITEIKNGKEIKVIKKKGKNGEEIFIKEIHGSGDDDGEEIIIITKDGDSHKGKNKEIKVIKKKGGDGETYEIKVEGKDGQEMIWIEKDGTEKGKVIIIEEVTEETDENGKKIKVVKKKKIVKEQ